MFPHKVLVIATSKKTRGGITSVIKAHASGFQWKKYKCHWIQTHRDGNVVRKLAYFIFAWIDYLLNIPFAKIIHIHTSGGRSGVRKYLFVKIAKVLGKKVIVHFHPPSEIVLVDKKRYSENTKNLFELADKVIVLAPQWIKWIEEAYPGIVYNVEVLFNPCPVVHRSKSERKNQILFAGSVIERKGYDTILLAFSKIATEFPSWRLVFAGNGEIEKGKQKSKELGISGQVDWLGWINGKEKEKVFNESSIYCLASWGEGFPMGILDAWAYGIPCVTTPVGGIPDIVNDGENGLVSPIKDAEVLAQKLSLLICDRELREKIVRETDKLCREDFNIEMIHKRLDNLYSNLLIS